MSDERYSAEVKVRITNHTTGVEEHYAIDRTGDLSRAGLNQWLAVVSPVRAALEKLNAEFLADDLVT